MYPNRIFVKVLIFVLVLLFSGLEFNGARSQEPGGENPDYISPQEITSYDNFGSALALSGDLLAVGAPGRELEGVHNGGAVYIFQRHGKEWEEAAHLIPDPPQAGSGFGSSVSINGKKVAVGARYEFNPESGNGSGAVYMYTQEDNAWQLQARLVAEDGEPFDLFGDAVALHGDLLAVGARAADGPDGERNTGAVYVFRRKGSAWNLQARLIPGDAAPEDHFGWALALDDQYLFISAPGRDAPQAPNSGLIYVYHYQGDAWVEQQQLAAVEPRPEAQLGSVICLEGGTLVALAGQEYQSGKMPALAPMYGGDFGAAHIFELQRGGWRWQARLTPVAREQDVLQLSGAAIADGPGRMRLALSGMGQGVIYRFQKKAGKWVELTALEPGLIPITLGGQIAIVRNQVLLGNRFYDIDSGPDSSGEPRQSAGAVMVLEW